MNQRGLVKLYCCGGAGINIGQKNSVFSGNDAGFAAIEPYFIDTAKSNFLKDRGLSESDENVYVFEGLDGSGGIRSENHSEISPRIREILQKLRPGELNIVLSSGGGGSGSTIANCLAGELISRNEQVIVIMIGSNESRKWASNTLSTIRSYDSLARKHNNPIVAAYVENNENNTEADADARVQEIILSLCILFSRQNNRLDSQDLFNWTHFHRVTGFPPGLAALFIGSSMEEIVRKNPAGQIGNVISIATLSRSPSFSKLKCKPEYHAIGFVDPEVDVQISDERPAHFVIADGFFNSVVASYEAELAEMLENQNARVSARPIIDSNVKTTDDGLVFD